MTLYDLFEGRVKEDPEAVAIVFGTETISYATLDEQVCRLAGGLHARGVGFGDRVLALAGNRPEIVALYLAVARVGAIFVPISSTFRAREGRFVLNNASPRLAFVESGMVAEFRSWPGGGALDLVVLDGRTAGVSGFSDVVDFEDFGNGVAEVAPVSVPDEAGLLLCYTSGTTSNPKPVLHSQGSEIYNATTYGDVWGLGPRDRGLVCLPLAWVYGLSTTTAALLVSGSTVVLLERFHPPTVIDAIEQERATAIWATMSMYTKLLEVISERGSADLSSLRLASNGGEPCPLPLVKEFEDRTGVDLLGSYATSEARPIMVVRPGDRHAPEGTAGQLVPGAEIRLEAPDGTEVPIGAAGHALLRCPGLMTEYFGEPELTAERLTADGWLKSGDLLRRDGQGYYFVVGRETDMIIRSGVNIAPAEVESALVSHPGIADAAVVGVPDARSGELIRAYLVRARGAEPTAGEIRLALERQLAAYKIPQEIEFIDELPRTDRGKVDRLALRARDGAQV